GVAVSSRNATESGTDTPLCEQFVEHRENLRRVADPAHHEMRMDRRHLVVGSPEVAVSRQSGQAPSHAVADFDIGEILAKRQNLAAQQGNATSAVRAVIVAVGSLSRVDVPPVGGISRPRNLQHFLERGRDYGAAGLPAVKERLFVDLFGGAGVTDEDDI